MKPLMIVDYQSEWVKILTKGLVTLPKNFRDSVGIREGDVARIRKIGRRLVIEPRDLVDYEVYPDKDLKAMLREDKLPLKLKKKAAKIWPELKQ